MNYRTSRGIAKIFILLPALVVAAGLVYYLHHTGKLDLSFLRKWQVQATNVYNKTTSPSGEPVQDKILSVDLDELSAGMTEDQINERFRALELSCYSVKDPLGDYACSTPIALFNDTRAKSVSFLFRRDRLTTLRVTLDSGQHQELATRLQASYGPSGRLGMVDPQSGRQLAGWKIAAGTLGLSESVPGDKEAVLLWMARSTAAGRR